MIQVIFNINILFQKETKLLKFSITDMSSDDNCDLNIKVFDESSAHVNKVSSGARAKIIDNNQTKPSNHKNQPKVGNKSHSFLPNSLTSEKWMISEAPSPYTLGRKKRQNGDEGESVAHSKRTCTSDRLTLPNRSKKNYRHFHKHFNKGPKLEQLSESDSYPSTSMEPHISFYDISGPKVYSSSVSNEHDIEAPSSSSSSSSFNNQSNHSNKTNTQFNETFCKPSTSNSKYGLKDHKQDEASSRQANSRGVTFIDSESDDSGPCSNISSRRHKYSPPVSPVLTFVRKGLRKVLESDDDEDEHSDEASWPNRYRRGVPLISSCSDDSSDIPIVPKKSYKKRYISQLSSTDSNDESSPSYISHSYPHSHQSSTSKKSSSERSSSSTHSKRSFENSYAARNVRESTNSSSLSSSTSISSQSTSSSSSSSSSSSLNRSSRYPHRDSTVCQSPPVLHASRRRNRGISRSAISQMGNISHTHVPRTLDFAERYPDVFDNEESSDMEFFTANSYSDTEASLSNMDTLVAQDLSGTSVRNRRSNNTFSISGSSPSEDEISVIFTSTFTDSNNRRIRNRGSGGSRRRRNRGSGRSNLGNNTDVVSLSPDPVAQVRQVEEDEELARRLQAEFDAEMNMPMRRENIPGLPNPQNTHNSDESDLEEIESTWEDNMAFTPNRTNRITPTFNQGQLFSPTRYTFPSNIVFLSQGGASGGRRRRGRRTANNGDPWMFQFARILGLNPAYTSPDESEYETLLQFAETAGDVPRGLRKTEINRLPTRTFYLPGSGPSTSKCSDDFVHKRTNLNKECQVCLSDYDNGDVLRILPCFHEFHTPCIDPWLKINHTCPVCRVEVAFED